MDLPKWVKRNPEKYKKRLLFENSQIRKFSPLFKMMQDEATSEIFFEGRIITRNNNIYNVKILPTDSYPYEAPVAVVMDPDVVRFCLNAGMHGSHNYGEYAGGVRICVIKPNDTQGIGWDPTLSMHSLILWTSEWLHAYEVKRKTGRWILPE